MSCRAVRDWLHRDADALDETQRLVLEDHLAACERCRGDREHLRLLRAVGTSLAVPPAGAREYSRAIARALLEDSGPRAAPAARSPRWSWRAMAAVAAVAAVLVAFALVRRGAEPVEVAVAPPAAGASTGPPELPGTPSSPPSPSPPSPSSPSSPSSGDARADPVAALTAPGDAPADAARSRSGDAGSAAPAGRVAIIEDGALAREGAILERGAAVPSNALLRATGRVRLRLASSHVVIAASSELRWSSADRTLRLERGALEVRGAGVARVITERFELELDGADASVEPALVRVHRGAVRVIDRAGAVARVDAGRAWRPGADRATSPTHGPAASELLAHARSRFAASDLAAAEQTATAALSASPTRGELAEARILLAEVAQASGALDLAVTRYAAVATAFADTPAAESALYAAARIELGRGRVAAARALFDRYLDRYPAGRYAADVHRALDARP